MAEEKTKEENLQKGKHFYLIILNKHHDTIQQYFKSYRDIWIYHVQQIQYHE